MPSETISLAESVFFVMTKASELFEEIVQKALCIHVLTGHNSVNVYCNSAVGEACLQGAGGCVDTGVDA